jgi:hypothetical protein
MLARAFDRAWEPYYMRQYLTIDPEIARARVIRSKGREARLARSGGAPQPTSH